MADFDLIAPTNQPLTPEQVYATIGEGGIARLSAAFYRQVPGDDLLAPMYPEAELLASEERLRDFLVFRFGGPTRYLDARGHPRLRMRHAPFPIDQAARDRWVALMDQAIADASLPANAATTLKRFFREVATFLINQQPQSDDASRPASP